MKQAFAVIGVGYGDEGKGLTTDYLVRKHTKEGMVPIVARGNGGAQAGHTVVTKDGKRHVFGHIGAGAFAGARTYLGRNFIMNPLALEKERKQLGMEAMLSANPKCRVTAIFDMALNALCELARGSNRHGSCGLGINETVTRHEAGYHLEFEDVLYLSTYSLAHKLKKIYNKYWVPRLEKIRADMAAAGISDFPAEAKDYLDMFENPDFPQIASHMKWLINIHPSVPLTEAPIIIEGAQGLMLDELLGEFPHVTRSITGLPSAMLVAQELDVDQVTPVYVTRTYTTRHGAGHLQHEGKGITEIAIEADKTNVYGQWQQNFRYAPLHLDHIASFIKRDLRRTDILEQLLGVKINQPEIMVTCMDQLGDHVNVLYCGQVQEFKTGDLLQLIESTVGLPVKYVSYGETAEHVQAR